MDFLLLLMKAFKIIEIKKLLKFDLFFSRIPRLLRYDFEKNHNIENSIFIAGSARSGTTWLAETLSNYFKYRHIFEPFDPRINSMFKYFPYKISNLKIPFHPRYIPPNYENLKFKEIFEKIITGRICNIRTDRFNYFFRPEGRVIKSIRSSYFLKWMRNNFPKLPIIFIIRHPCAVVLSRINMGLEGKRIRYYIETR